ncbi:hypothetical protein JHK84_055636 [Glycine max]|nr:hypothetical protein JHK84_055636 [Glycine max]
MESDNAQCNSGVYIKLKILDAQKTFLGLLDLDPEKSSMLRRLDTFNDLEVTLRNFGENDLEEPISITSQDLGTGFTPPYLSPSTIGPIVLKGVNYASGGGGIFVTIMISKLKVHLIRLFNLGGRKFVVANVGPTGCIPNQKDINKAEIYSIKLSGDPKLGEGKPENQNHAIVFTRGEAVQTIGMNQTSTLFV